MESWKYNPKRRGTPFIIVPMNPIRVEKDKYGVKLKHPNRKCIECQRYPCFPEIHICSSNFAAYGCTKYVEPKISD